MGALLGDDPVAEGVELLGAGEADLRVGDVAGGEPLHPLHEDGVQTGLSGASGLSGNRVPSSGDVLPPGDGRGVIDPSQKTSRSVDPVVEVVGFGARRFAVRHRADGSTVGVGSSFPCDAIEFSDGRTAAFGDGDWLLP